MTVWCASSQIIVPARCWKLQTVRSESSRSGVSVPRKFANRREDLMTTIPAVSLTIDAVPVLEQHRFPEDRLEHYLCQHVEGFTAPLQVAQTQGGMSNPTFILTDGAE